MQAKFSRTLRRYGFCEADPWTAAEADAADLLLRGLRAKGQMQRASLAATGKPSDEDAWIWPATGPAFDALLAEQVGEVAEYSQHSREFLVEVAKRLRGELYMPAVRE